MLLLDKVKKADMSGAARTPDTDRADPDFSLLTNYLADITIPAQSILIGAARNDTLKKYLIHLHEQLSCSKQNMKSFRISAAERFAGLEIYLRSTFNSA